MPSYSVCNLFSFCACKFPVKYENRESGVNIVDYTLYATLFDHTHAHRLLLVVIIMTLSKNYVISNGQILPTVCKIDTLSV